MLDLLQGIVDFIAMIGNFLGSLLSGFVSLFGYISMAAITVGEVLVFLPEDIAVIALAFVSMSIVFLIVGR